MTRPGPGVFGNLTLAFAVTTASTLEIAAGHYLRSRLLDTPGGRYLAAGVALRRPGTSTAMRPREPLHSAGLPPPVRGVTRFVIAAPSARRVELAGDWNHWRAIPATRARNGVWYADLRIRPGRYRYAFRIDGRAWRVPAGSDAVPDDFGGQAAWLTVAEPQLRPANDSSDGG